MQSYQAQRELSRFFSAICPLLAPQATPAPAWGLGHAPSHCAQQSDAAMENMALKCPTWTFLQPDSRAVCRLLCTMYEHRHLQPSPRQLPHVCTANKSPALQGEHNLTQHPPHVKGTTEHQNLGYHSSTITSVTKFTVSCSFPSLTLVKR